MYARRTDRSNAASRLSPMQRCNSTRQIAIARIFESRREQEIQKFGLRRELTHGIRQILICSPIPRDQRANVRQNVTEVKAEDVFEYRHHRLGKFQNDNDATRPKDAIHLDETARRIFEVTKTKCNRKRIEAMIRKR